MRTEIMGIKIERIEDYDSNGRMRLWWVLRNEEGHIEYQCKTWEDLVHEMMWATVEYNKDGVRR